MSGRDIPDSVLLTQQQASDPAASAWVSANAGSGKTFVLAQRVVRLLLAGTDPAKILCLTFTKAAAATMASRVFDTLAAWTALDDAALDAEMRATGLKAVTAATRARARRLFAAALETPGGLKVQTIHAFCTRLLQQFPCEGAVTARFRVMEDAQQRQMLEDIQFGVLLDASGKPESAAGAALAHIIAGTSDFMFRAGLAEAIDKRDRIADWLAQAGGIAGAMAGLSAALGIAVDDSLARVHAEIVGGPHFPRAAWADAAAACGGGNARDLDQAERLRRALHADGRDCVEAYFEVFLDKSAKPRGNLLTKDVAARHPALALALAAEQARVATLCERRNAIVIRARTAALLTLAGEVIARYGAEKARRGLLDYDDLITHARTLLNSIGAAWVHYKLDFGIDHLLIDEAQDTSPEQWDIVRRLVSEFTAGAGARSVRRTIFAVGDDKQSIFSFQGAAPQEFEAMQREFRARFQAGDLEWRDVRLTHSFRSGQSVLAAVDTVFRDPKIYGSITADSGGIAAHVAMTDAAPSLVELWPLERPDDTPEIEEWDAPFDRSSETSPRVKLARRIARAVRTWIARRDRVGSGDARHAVRPGDVLVLVRQRGPLFEGIIRALKDADIPVAGADRLMLTDHIAIMDLLVLADAVLLPQDDLALATVLKSPLIGLSEDDLFAVAWNRRGSLRAALAERRPDIAAQIDTIARDARSLSPFAFYAQLLGAGDGRRRIVARLGFEANDALDEFLNLALAYESRETPSLHGFVAWLRTASAEVKRDMEISRDEVRVMTVHGAKGLEAPIVILADTTTPPEGPPLFQPRLLPLPDTAGMPQRLIWVPRQDHDTGVVEAARTVAIDAIRDEYRRLLYVAMTRAADRLIVCGSVGVRAMPDGCWYGLIDAALTATGELVEEPSDAGDGDVRRYRKEPAAPPETGPAPAEPPPVSDPPWLRVPVPGEAPPPVQLTPAGAGPAIGAGAAGRRAALLRGSLMHRMMQSLPDVAPERRAAAAARYLARAGQDFSAGDREAMTAQVLAIVSGERFAPLFAPGSRAEVPIVGRLVAADGTPVPVSGQVDRLVVTESAVLIADYKTNRPAPTQASAVPPAYVRQLALYRALLMQLYPGRPVRAALVWTDVPDLMEISATALDAEIARLTAGAPA